METIRKALHHCSSAAYAFPCNTCICLQSVHLSWQAAGQSTAQLQRIPGIVQLQCSACHVHHPCVLLQVQASQLATPKHGLVHAILHLGDRVGASLGSIKDDFGQILPLRADPVGDFLNSAASAADWEDRQWDPLAQLFNGALSHGGVRSKYDPFWQVGGVQVQAFPSHRLSSCNSLTMACHPHCHLTTLFIGQPMLRAACTVGAILPSDASHSNVQARYCCMEILDTHSLIG